MGRKGYAFLTTGLFLLLLTAALLYLLANPDRWLYRDTVTTTQHGTGTQTTQTTSSQQAEVETIEYAAAETYGTMKWLEKHVFDLVNYERTSRGLTALKWNEEIADVCRAHSKDMADNDFFSHTGSDSTNSSYRLILGGVCYWNLTGENIARVNIIDVYVVNTRGEVVDIKYKTLEKLVQDTIDGWMNSPVHRQNILSSKFDEAGIGLTVFNDSYYFTENFITRITCGYKDAACCEKVGYLPWCYRPWECVSGFCI